MRERSPADTGPATAAGRAPAAAHVLTPARGAAAWPGAARIAPPTPAALLELQRSAGNRAATSLCLGRRNAARAAVLAREEGPGAPPAPPKEHLKAWKAAGPFGDDLLKLLSELLTPSEVAKLLEGVGEKVGEAVGDPAGKGSGKAIGATVDWAAVAAQDWLKGPKGERFLAALRKQLGESPDPYYRDIVQSLASSLLIAAKLYADNQLDPPKLEKELKLAAGKLALTGSLDLGKPKDGWLQGAGVGLKYQVVPSLTLGLGGTVGMGALGPIWSASGSVDAELFKKYLVAKAKFELGSDPAKNALTLGAGGKAGAFDYGLSSTLGLTPLQLTALQAHLGYTSKDATLGFLTKVTYELADGKDTFAARMAVGSVVGRYTLFLDANGRLKPDSGPSGDVTALVGYKLAPNLNLGLVGGFGYGPTGVEATGPSAWQVHGGLAYKPDKPTGWATLQYNAPLGSGGLPGFVSLGYMIPLGKAAKGK